MTARATAATELKSLNGKKGAANARPLLLVGEWLS